MSDAHDRNNERAMRANERTYLEPPEYIEDNPDWQDKRQDMTDERVLDLNGYLLEGITERPESDLLALATLINGDDDMAGNAAIGILVRRWVREYCTPDDEDVTEALHGHDGV